MKYKPKVGDYFFRRDNPEKPSNSRGLINEMLGCVIQVTKVSRAWVGFRIISSICHKGNLAKTDHLELHISRFKDDHFILVQKFRLTGVGILNPLVLKGNGVFQDLNMLFRFDDDNSPATANVTVLGVKGQLGDRNAIDPESILKTEKAMVKNGILPLPNKPIWDLVYRAIELIR